MMYKDTQSPDYWSVSPEELIRALESSPNGLSPQEAQRRLVQEGPNTLGTVGRAPAWRLFLRQFESPLVLILIFAALVSAFLQDWTDAAVILTIVLASAIITFTQENMASKAVEKLRQRIRHEVDALRDGRTQRIPAADVVRGDVILLSAGSLIPADGVLLEAKDLFVNQAVLTGETFPVEKEIGTAAPGSGLAERSNCVYMGTTVRSGTGHMLVAASGPRTAFGQIAGQLNLRPPET
jgi:Mg2+-importing ATPase